MMPRLAADATPAYTALRNGNNVMPMGLILCSTLMIPYA
jgi:hypothetical protein